MTTSACKLSQLEINRIEAENARLAAELAAERARMEWLELHDAEVRRDDEQVDEDDRWTVVVWVTGRGRTYGGGTLAEAIDAAMKGDAS